MSLKDLKGKDRICSVREKRPELLLDMVAAGDELTEGLHMKVFERIAERSIGNLIALFCAALCLVASASLALAMLAKDPTPPASERRFDTPMLIAIEADGCGDCDAFRRTVAKTYRASPTAEKMPLSFLSSDNSRTLSSYALKSAKVEAGQILLIDRYGREIGRTNISTDLSPLQTFAEGYMRRALK
jgi:hypothetical protein